MILEAKNKYLYIDNKKLPTSISEFKGKVLNNDLNFIEIEVLEINDFCMDNNFRRMKGKPKIEILKIKKPISGIYMEFKEGDILLIISEIIKKEIFFDSEKIYLKEKIIKMKKV